MYTHGQDSSLKRPCKVKNPDNQLLQFHGEFTFAYDCSRNSHTHFDYLHNSCQASKICEASSMLISGHIGEVSSQALFSFPGCITVGRSTSFKEMLTPTSKIMPGPLVMDRLSQQFTVHVLKSKAWDIKALNDIRFEKSPIQLAYSTFTSDAFLNLLFK